MKHLSNSIYESLMTISIEKSTKSSQGVVLESKFPAHVYAGFFSSAVDSEAWEYLEDEYGIPTEYIEYIETHCRCVPPMGGFNGNGESAADVLRYWEIEFKGLDDIEVDPSSIYDFLPEGIITDKGLLRSFRKCFDGFKPITGAIWYCKGYASPAIILFDKKDSISKEILNNIEVAD